MNLNQATLPITNFEQSVDFYRRMGFNQVVHAPPAYARFECPEGDSTFSIHTVPHPVNAVPTGVVVYFECSDLDARVEALIAAGFRFMHLPRDERWLWREARLLDPSGNMLCLYRAGENRKNPPWRVGGRLPTPG
ncbi:VOC family protein [Burkholderia sp.]|uniref:VOC family protein n=1 Tax=Burkholderia sp. TaxID=36773 RepID=UPI0025861B2F|nr:VOC family protein [Burkholderia sp.]MCA3931540.1 VOC family protein [Burkholderia sp.]